MAHIQKFKRSAVSQMAAHYRRLRDERHYGNQNIDATRTAGNYFLGGECDVTARVAELVAQHKEVTGRALRKDAVVMFDVIDTLPRNWPKERDPRDYFEACHRFNLGFFPGEPLLAVVHVDETTPHMHQAFAPVDEDGRFAYKRLMPRSKYQDYHEELQKFVRKELELPDLEILLGEETGAQRALSGAREQERLGAVLDYVGRRMDDYLGDRRDELDEVEQTLSQVQDTLTRRQGELRDINVQLPDKRAELDGLERTVTQKKTELDGLKRAVAQARTKRETEETATREAHEKHERAKKECADAETQKAEAVAARDSARAERAEAEVARDKARTDANAEEKRLADLQKQSEVEEASVRSALAQEKRTRERHDSLKGRLTELESQVAEKEGRLTELETQVAEKEGRLADLKRDFEALIEQVWNRLLELWDKYGPWKEEHNQEWVTQAVDSVLEEEERG